MKKCNHCLEWKDESEFTWRYKGLGILQKTCRACKAEQDAKWYDSHKEEHRENVKRQLAEKRRIAKEYRDNLIVFSFSNKACFEGGWTKSSSMMLGSTEDLTNVMAPWLH